ncbi:hypothetical protein V6N11_050287 [Hibiscus sabdariffa]|uniref:Uncharacterized protein n=1 Tax=Hibiscus sabdariffa TaxID=183260 RepID=A0ABR2T9J8_9ROSI
MACSRSMECPEAVWRALVAPFLRIAAGGYGVFSLACFAQGMAVPRIWRCPACMTVYVSDVWLLKCPFTRPYPCPWNIRLFSLSSDGTPCAFSKIIPLPILFRCLVCLGIADALFVTACGTRHFLT